MSRSAKFTFFCFLVLSFTAVTPAQAKKTKRPVKAVPAAAATPEPVPEPTPEPTPEAPKQNKRPGGAPKESNKTGYTPAYFYEFTRPGFSYGRILIEHDEAGHGKISFLKAGFDELLTDPIELSAATLAKINDALTALDFFESTESYQYSRDYPQMGNMTLTVRRSGRERTVKYNWTENKNAKVLMDEYRRISNEYTWRFEMTTARENQPLQTPVLMELIDGYFKRGEISDPPHMLPFLKELSTDERLPLMARNRALSIIKQIEKTTNK
jgi:hypothetical protein